VHHDEYYPGEKGFIEVRYNGWISPYRIYGQHILYTFDKDSRTKLIDKRDADILETIVDGVKVFDKV